MRQPGESYEDYRKRQRHEQRELKRYLRGRIFHNVYSYIDDNGKGIPGKGTYVKEIK